MGVEGRVGDSVGADELGYSGDECVLTGAKTQYED